MAPLQLAGPEGNLASVAGERVRGLHRRGSLRRHGFVCGEKVLSEVLSRVEGWIRIRNSKFTSGVGGQKSGCNHPLQGKLFSRGLAGC